MFPCKDCITFPACKSQYIQKSKYIYRSAHRLTKKCTILLDYLNKYHSTRCQYNFHTYYKPVIQFFKDEGNI